MKKQQQLKHATKQIILAGVETTLIEASQAMGDLRRDGKIDEQDLQHDVLTLKAAVRLLEKTFFRTKTKKLSQKQTSDSEVGYFDFRTQSSNVIHCQECWNHHKADAPCDSQFQDEEE